MCRLYSCLRCMNFLHSEDSQRLVVKHTFIDFIDSPTSHKAHVILGRRSSSDSALSDIGWRKGFYSHGPSEVAGDGQVAFELCGLSDHEADGEATQEEAASEQRHADLLVGTSVASNARPWRAEHSGADPSTREEAAGVHGVQPEPEPLRCVEAAELSAVERLAKENKRLQRENELLAENARLALENRRLRQQCMEVALHRGRVGTGWTYAGGPSVSWPEEAEAGDAEARPQAPNTQLPRRCAAEGAGRHAVLRAPRHNGSACGQQEQPGSQPNMGGVPSSPYTWPAEEDEPPGQQEAIDNRTTVMLRNLPNNYTRSMLIAMLNKEGFSGQFDFIYLPMDFRSHACLGYAFINLIHPSMVSGFWAAFDGYSSWFIPSRKVCYVSWCGPHQGCQAHVERYRNSPVMHPEVPDEYKPMVFVCGMPVEFPAPTRKPRVPRVRNYIRPDTHHPQAASGHAVGLRGSLP